MTEPSIKGSAFQGLIDDVSRLRREGRISDEEIEKHLTDEDVELLDSPVLTMQWYPMDQYSRFTELIVAKEANGRRADYLIERGYRAAERLLDGVYKQFVVDGQAWGPTVGNLLLPLAGMIYNFTEWNLDVIEAYRRYKGHVTATSEFPDAARYTAQGFIHCLAARAAGKPMRVTSERLDARRVVFLIETDESGTDGTGS